MAEEENKPTNPNGGRKTWNKDEWEAKAKTKDEAYAEKAKEAEKSIASGKRPRFDMENIPKPTKNLEQRKEDLNIEKNLNKTMLVQTVSEGKGPKGPGFYCDMCNRTLKDSISYLDHVNGRIHLARLGQTTQVARSTLSQVRLKIAHLREETASKTTAKNYDFQARLAQVRKTEKEERDRRKEEKKRKREARREVEELGRKGVLVVDGVRGAFGNEKEVEEREREVLGIQEMMGFGGFGGTKKK